MIDSLSKDGMRQLAAHLENVQNALCFIESHEDCIRLEDDDYAAIYRTQQIVDALRDCLDVNINTVKEK